MAISNQFLRLARTVNRMPILPQSSRLILGSLALLVAACAVPQDATNASAAEALEQGKFRQAQAHLAEVFTRGDENSETYLIRAKLKLAIGDGHSALASIENVSSQDMDDDARRVATAHALILQERFEDALELYAESDPAELAEQDLRMVLWALYELDADEAFAAGMDVALDSYPDSVELNYLAGKQLLELDIAQEAQVYADRALEGDPSNFDVRLLQGELAIAEGKLDEALTHYSKAAELRPGDPIPPANVGGLQLDLGRIEDARKTLEPAIIAHPDEPLLQWKKARLSLVEGKLEDARLALERARPFFRGNDEFTLLSAQVEDRLGNHTMALSEYQRYVRAVGGDQLVEQRISELEEG
jgi:Flp pilus assembly protein TadD